MQPRNTQKTHKSVLPFLWRPKKSRSRGMFELWGKAYFYMICWGDKAMLGSNLSTQQKKAKTAEQSSQGDCFFLFESQASCLLPNAINPDERSEESLPIILTNMDKYCISLFLIILCECVLL